MPFPAFSLPGNAQTKMTFMCKTAQLPGSTLGVVPVQYFGRELKFVGNRTFADWTVTIINDEDFFIRNAMEAWSNAINSHDSNSRALPQTYKSNAIITQYSKDGRSLRTYVFEGIYPITVGSIPMGWESTDQIENFDVTFQYDLWRVEGATGISTT